MTHIYTIVAGILIGGLVIFVITAGVPILLRRIGFQQGVGQAHQVFPVWAALGPFENGAESAVAMRCAFLAVLGREKMNEFGSGFAEHEMAYEGDPEKWEETRLATLAAARANNKAHRGWIETADKFKRDLEGKPL